MLSNFFSFFPLLKMIASKFCNKSVDEKCAVSLKLWQVCTGRVQITSSWPLVKVILQMFPTQSGWSCTFDIKGVQLEATCRSGEKARTIAARFVRNART